MTTSTACNGLPSTAHAPGKEVSFAPNLTSSLCSRRLPSWFFPAWPCDEQGKRIADIVMQYLFEGKVQVYLYSDRDVIAVTDERLGEGAVKTAYRAIAYFSNTECAALVTGFSEPLEKEYQFAVQWNDQRGLLSAIGYYEEPRVRAMLVTPRFDTSLDKFMAMQKEFSLRSWEVISVRLLEGVTRMHRDGYVHNDFAPRNILVKFVKSPQDQPKEVEDCAICDYGEMCKAVRNTIEAQLETLIDFIVQEVGSKTDKITQDRERGDPYLDIVTSRLRGKFQFGQEFEFLRKD